MSENECDDQWPKVSPTFRAAHVITARIIKALLENRIPLSDPRRCFRETRSTAHFETGISCRQACDTKALRFCPGGNGTFGRRKAG